VVRESIIINRFACSIVMIEHGSGHANVWNTGTGGENWGSSPVRGEVREIDQAPELRPT